MNSKIITWYIKLMVSTSDIISTYWQRNIVSSINDGHYPHVQHIPRNKTRLRSLQLSLPLQGEWILRSWNLRHKSNRNPW